MLKNIKGIGPKTQKILEKNNITTPYELITYYPYKYKHYHPEKIENATENEEILINGYIYSLPKTSYIKRNLQLLCFNLNTNNKIIKVVIFNRNFIKPNLTINKLISVIGKYDIRKNTLTAADIKLVPILQDKLEPIYHQPQGLKQININKIINSAIEEIEEIPELIPREISEKYNFISKKEAIKEIHSPTSLEKLKQSQLLLKYEELFEFTLKINYLKMQQEKDEKNIKTFDKNKVNKLISNLPYNLTQSQLEAIEDIKQDLNGKKVMNRLILGDVGSGKTIVSFIALYMNYLSGYQGILMAPTEILAQQHYQNIIKLFPHINIKILTSSISNSEKETIIKEINNIDIIISTHAVLNEKIKFKNLGLVITDEQHRFGVNQRKILQNKGKNVDSLFMSATPIPRTLALTLFKDMDITEIKTKPKNRKPKITKLYKNKDIKQVLYEIVNEIKKNNQIYVVSPLIEDNEENGNLASVKYLYKKINEALNEKVPISLIHGKIKKEEQEKIMNDFKNNKTKILISTTIIETGVDVENATMIVIFNAERFGLATLHQLRGRIGRNDKESKCILISDYDTPRLEILEESDDGFYIAEKDFELRGTGDIFGVRQSGEMEFKIADLKKDYKILKQSSKDSQMFLEKYINIIEEYPNQKKIILSINKLN